jgi:putative tryptophan/tyrosine transport system substrate-binding protein
MRRAVLISAVLAAISPTYAEAAERVWRMSVLALADDGAVRSIMLPYLATRGFVEGRNLVVYVRVGCEEQMPELAQALVGDKPDVIIAISDWALHAARAATSTIPIRSRSDSYKPLSLTAMPVASSNPYRVIARIGTIE